jgi:hypothetical protein
VVICSIPGSPSRHNRRARRSGLGEILRLQAPRNGDALSACKWAKEVWLFDIAQQGASSPRTRPGTDSPGRQEGPSLPAGIRSLGDVFA